MNAISWSDIFDKYNTQEVVTGKILEKVPGGLTVSVFGADAFLPWSQVPQYLKDKADSFTDYDINFRILKINAFGNNIVVSRTAFLEQEKLEAYHDAIKEIHEGSVYDAVVKNIVSYGVFVTINNKIDGLIPSKELSWNFVSDINQIVAINDIIRVKVKSIDEDGRRLTLSHKECVSSPWESFDTAIYYRNAIIDVKVARIIEHGVIVTLENSCQGMLPSKEVAWNETEPDLKSLFTTGDKLTVKLLSVDTAKQKLYVSLKQVQEKPANYIPVGKRMYCTIERETDEGLNLLTNKQIPVFLPKSEISWIKHYDLNDFKNPAGKLQIVIIKNTNDEIPNIASIRQMYPDPMMAYTSKSIHKGTVSGELAKVYFVNFKDGLTGIILKDSLPGHKLKKGTEISTIVVSSDKESRRIILKLHKESEFTGNDIMEMLGLKPSRTVGILKRMLSDAVESGEIDSSFAAGAAYIKEKAKEVL